MKLKYLTLKKLILIMLLLMLPTVLAGDPETIIFRPGELINLTGIQCLEQNSSYCTDDIQCNLTLQSSNGTILIDNGTMYTLGLGLRGYNTNLTYEEETTLSAVVSCSNGGVNSFVISVEYDEDQINTIYLLYLSLASISVIFFIIGLNKDKYLYGLFAGFIMAIIGVVIIVNGFPNVTDSFLTENSGIALLGIGAGFIIYEIGKIEEAF